MSWGLRRIGSALHVRIEAPVADWEAVLDGVQANLDPKPSAIVLPEVLDGATHFDAEMLKLLGVILAAAGIAILPPG